MIFILSIQCPVSESFSPVTGKRTPTFPNRSANFPLQEELSAKLRGIGFTEVSYRNLTNGIAVIHEGEKQGAREPRMKRRIAQSAWRIAWEKTRRPCGITAVTAEQRHGNTAANVFIPFRLTTCALAVFNFRGSFFRYAPCAMLYALLL